MNDETCPCFKACVELWGHGNRDPNLCCELCLLSEKVEVLEGRIDYLEDEIHRIREAVSG